MTLASERLRLWPGILIVVLQWVLWLLLPIVAPDRGLYGVLGGLLCGLAVLAWWAFFSRVPVLERWGAIALIVAVLILTPRILDPSLAKGMMGMLIYIYAVPLISLALVVWVVTCSQLATAPRRAALALAILGACGVLTFLRTEGMKGDGRSQFTWRWSKTNEQQLLSRAESQPPAPAPGEAPVVTPPQPVAAVPAARPTVLPASRTVTSIPVPEWPGFRGSQRDGRVTGLRIATDWNSSPPVQLWRRPIGPGWSSFAVGGGLLYTQEQRGDHEIVACYRVTTGEPVWSHRTKARFWESNAGAGPRGTPTLANVRVYALGATGILNALNAMTGRLVWTKNVVTDTGINVPEWGISSSPLVVGDLAIVAASGRLAAYDIGSGELRWAGPSVKGSYGSPHLVTLHGLEQIVLLTNAGAFGVAPNDGSVLWQHEWLGGSMLQPALIGDSDLLITTASAAGGLGTRRVSVSRTPSGWTADEVWTSIGLKPYFNDLVVHKGHAFGFDGSILACIDLKDGKRKWKGGRFGHGQMVLLADQDLLLVLSEEGELALVSATPAEFTEVARFKVLDGKTWNHPAIVGDTLLVRNGEEMAAFRLQPSAN